MQSRTHFSESLDELGSRVITHLGDVPRRHLSEAIS